MKVKELIKELSLYNQEAEISTLTTRDIKILHENDNEDKKDCKEILLYLGTEIEK